MTAIIGVMPRARRSPGSRTALDVLRGLLRPTDPDAVTKVVAEMDAGQLIDRPVAVTCFLRGAAAGFPHRWCYGILTLDGRALTWEPFLWRGNRVIRLPSRLDVEQVREVRGAEGFKIQRDLFRIVVCQATSGRVELGVPTLDVPLIRRAIQRDQGTSGP